MILDWVVDMLVLCLWSHDIVFRTTNKEDNMTKITRYKVKSIERKIELFSGRPDRDTTISKEDILNLRIALNTSAPEGHDPLHYFLFLT